MLPAPPSRSSRPVAGYCWPSTASADGTADLDGGMRLQVLDILIAALEGSYAHLVAKRAAYASNPVQALTLLRRRSSDLSDAEFHRAVSTIMTGLRDAHTRYIGPNRLRDQVAVLPFLAEQYGPDTAPRYLVSKVTPRRPTWPMPTSSWPVSSWSPGTA